MHKSIINLNEIKKEINSKSLNIQSKIKIIAVSKTFGINDILPLIDSGHLDFGENKIQEAVDKWTQIKLTNKEIKLHMIGKLQSNKVKQAVNLFDYIHSLDSTKLAEKISNEEKKIKKKIKLFIQINIGNEDQKNGIKIEDLPDFYQNCKNNLDLDIIGLMCLPPINTDPSVYFSKMKIAAKNLSLKELSMGMSSDYLSAVKHNASFIRIGSKIFGNRNQ